MEKMAIKVGAWNFGFASVGRVDVKPVWYGCKIMRWYVLWNQGPVSLWLMESRMGHTLCARVQQYWTCMDVLFSMCATCMIYWCVLSVFRKRVYVCIYLECILVKLAPKGGFQCIHNLFNLEILSTIYEYIYMHMISTIKTENDSFCEFVWKCSVVAVVPRCSIFFKKPSQKEPHSNTSHSNDIACLEYLGCMEKAMQLVNRLIISTKYICLVIIILLVVILLKSSCVCPTNRCECFMVYMSVYCRLIYIMAYCICACTVDLFIVNCCWMNCSLGLEVDVYRKRTI